MLGVARAGERGGVAARIDAGNLRGGESDHLAIGVVPERQVEIVEIAAGRAEDGGAHGALGSACVVRHVARSIGSVPYSTPGRDTLDLKSARHGESLTRP